MARGLHQLTAKQVENAAPGTAINDGGGLSLRCGANGNKRWVYRFKMKGQPQREMGLGAFPGTTLAQARKKATEARDLVARELDPIEVAHETVAQARTAAEAEANAVSFGTYADKFVEWKIIAGRFTNPKHVYQWRHTFTGHAASLRDIPLADVTREDILAVLNQDVLVKDGETGRKVPLPMWDAQHVTAVRVRGRLENLFDHAIQNNSYHRDNPARWEQFNATLSPPRKLTRGHQPAMPARDVPAFMTALREREGFGPLALEFLILTATRSGEVRLARWAEVDLEVQTWTIPADRMKTRRDKGRRDHVVPLTDEMVGVLERAQDMYLNRPDADALLFPGAKPGRPLSDMTLRAVMLRMDQCEYVPHGFRSVFSDWARNETEFPRELAEEALAHQLPEVERAYRRGQAVERRRLLMQAWGDFVCGNKPSGENIVHLAGRK